MKFSFILIVSLSLLPCRAYCDDAGSKEKEFDIKAKKVIVKFTGERIEPAFLELDRLDSSVFFINQSQNKDVNLEINFKDKKVHCHANNLELKDGYLITPNPIKPRDFEIFCLPTAGSYPYTVKENSFRGKSYAGEIVVHE